MEQAVCVVKHTRNDHSHIIDHSGIAMKEDYFPVHVLLFNDIDFIIQLLYEFNGVVLYGDV